MKFDYICDECGLEIPASEYEKRSDIKCPECSGNFIENTNKQYEQISPSIKLTADHPESDQARQLVQSCESCLHKFSKRAKICPKCGWKSLESCGICHQAIPYDSTSCPECGDPSPFESNHNISQANENIRNHDETRNISRSINIEKLEVDENWKKIFRLFHANPTSTDVFGSPIYHNDDIRFRSAGSAIFKKENIMYNWWAFIFSVFWYFAKGMWKKGLLLIAVSFALNLIVYFIFSSLKPNIGGYFIMAYALRAANYDYYRNKVLKEDFWW